MKEHLQKYEKELKEIFVHLCEMPTTGKSLMECAELVEAMVRVEQLEELTAGEDETPDCSPTLPAPTCRITEAQACEWVNRMHGGDKESGMKWTKAETSAVAEQYGICLSGIEPWEWWATMHMMYYDFKAVAVKFGLDSPEFYAKMAYAFLHDPDGFPGGEKLCRYYREVVPN